MNIYDFSSILSAGGRDGQHTIPPFRIRLRAQHLRSFSTNLFQNGCDFMETSSVFFSFFKLNTRVGLYSLISVGSLRSKLGALFHSVTHRQKRGVEPSLMTGLSEPATTETMSRYHR